MKARNISPGKKIYRSVIIACGIFTLLLFPALTALSQPIERKIIIENGTCYYMTIDPEFQIATLHTVDFDKPLKLAKKYALPAGRNLNVPVIPFSWDVAGKDVLAINFMNNALNNRRNAIKRIPMNTLNEWNAKISISDVVVKSTEIQPYTSFEPYEYITDKSNILEHFFFDVVVTSDSSFCLAISNKGELTIWNFSNNKWEKGTDFPLPVTDFFSLFVYRQQTYLATSDGNIYSVQKDKSLKKSEQHINPSFSDGILIIDKTNNNISFIDKAMLNEQQALSEIMKHNAISIFL